MKRQPLQLPALDPADVAEVEASGYPQPFRPRVAGRRRRRLGEACGLGQFGVNQTTLPPGAQSALRHWHTHEDEFVYVLEGELVLVTDAGEQVLRTGQCAGFPAGRRDGHHFINRSTAPAVYLEIGSRSDADVAAYPDEDLQLLRDVSGLRYAHKDGQPW